MSESSQIFVGEVHLTLKDIFLSLAAQLPGKLLTYALIGAIGGIIIGGVQSLDSFVAIAFFGTLAFMTVFMGLFAIIMVPINTLICVFRLSSEHKHCVYTLDKTGHKIVDHSGMNFGISWQQIEWAKITKHAIHLQVKKVGMRWIPLRAYSAEEHLALPEFLAEHTQLKS